MLKPSLEASQPMSSPMLDGMVHKMRLKKMLTHLDAERKMILAGSYQNIDKMIETREVQIAEIEDLSDEIRASLAPLLVEIRAKSDRNRGLLKQALAGLSKSRAFLREIAEARQKLRTYNQSGQSVDVSMDLGNQSRKA